MRDRLRWRYWLFETRKRYGLYVLNNIYIVTSNHIVRCQLLCPVRVNFLDRFVDIRAVQFHRIPRPGTESCRLFCISAGI